MRGAEHADLGRDRTQVGEAAAVDADAFLDDPLADQLLGERADRFLDLLLAAGELAWRLGGASQLGDRLRRGLVGGGVAIGLRRDRDGLGECVGGDPLDRVEHVVAVVDDRRERERLDRTTGGDDAGDELALQCDRLLDPLLARLEAGGEHRLVDLRGAFGVVGEALLGAACLDHHDGDVAVSRAHARRRRARTTDASASANVGCGIHSPSVL